MVIPLLVTNNIFRLKIGYLSASDGDRALANVRAITVIDEYTNSALTSYKDYKDTRGINLGDHIELKIISKNFEKIIENYA